jgi:hypothetical protein
MNLPFTTDQFLEVFRQYNQSVFPMQIVLLLTAVLSVYLAVKNKPYSNKFISLVLAFYWLWMGIVYHLLNFTSINKAAYLFGILYIVQGILFLYMGLFKKSLSFSYTANTYGLLGSLLILYALIIYPIIGHLSGHAYPYSPTFGLPCPTTIFTFGILLWSDKRVPLTILIIPFLWSIVGFTAALSLGIYEDIGLLVAGLVAVLSIMVRNRKLKNTKETEVHL